jgi:hypothetical protein
LDEDLNKIGQVHPLGAPSLTLDRFRQVKRSLEGVSLMPPDSTRLTYRTRLAPVWVFDDGSTYNLGVFVLSDETVGPDEQGRLDSVAMGDQMSLYRSSLEQTFVVRPGDQILEKLVEVHQLAPNPAPYVGYSHITETADQSMVWPVATPIADVMEELAEAAGVRAWFTREGQLRFDFINDDDDPIDLVNHIEGTLQYSYSNEDTPNRWVVRDNGNDQSITGVYELPDAAPHSFAKRGRWITNEVEIPGLVGQDAADVLAMEAAFAEEFPYKEASLELPARPDLDVFDSVRLHNGQIFRIDSVTTDLVPSGTSQVECQALWENPDTARLEPKVSFEGSEPISGDIPPTRAFMLWTPAFLKKWRSLTPRQQRQLRAYFDGLAQQRAEREERRRRRRAQRRRKGRHRRNRMAKAGQKRRAGRVQTYDPHLRLATVLLDGDPTGNEVPVRMETDIPGNDQRVMVQFNSPTPTAVGIEGGINRLLGYAVDNTVQTIDSLARTDLEGVEVEVTITQPGRVIMVTGCISTNMITAAEAFATVILYAQRDDGEGNYTDLGEIGSVFSIPNTPGHKSITGEIIDASPDPGVYSYRLQVQNPDFGNAGSGYRIRGSVRPTMICVWDVGADIEATSA